MTILERINLKIKPNDARNNQLRYEDFPAVFRAADKYSLAQQKIFFSALFFELLFLIVSTTLSMLNIQWASVAIIQAIVLFGALACAIYLFTSKPDRHWYSARAVAESVKTVTWRYVTRAEPFDSDDASACTHFIDTLNDVVEQNRDVAKRFHTDLDGTQITLRINELRQATFDRRKSVYIRERVIDQQNWYARKNKINNRSAKSWFILLALCITLAGISAICRIQYIQASIWPTDIFAGLATTILAWSQAKRFSELAASYSLAAYEISMIREQANTVTDDTTLSRYVGDAENAFSREHTQWVARKDE